MPRKASQSDPNQGSLFDVQEYLKTAPCVPFLRQRVAEWRAKNYPGATEITRQLLHWWFQTDHRLVDGRRFQYHPSQRDAIETLIYVYEVEQVRTRRDLLQRYARQSGEIRIPPEDAFARYCTKMATGSGKTKVMSLAVVWQYWNAVVGGNDQDYARTFLIIAPNVIVLERLKSDFAGGHIFQVDPVMPPFLRALGWEMDYVMRGEGERAATQGLLLLTNIQQLYDRSERKRDDEPDALTDVLGPRPAATPTAPPDFASRIAARDGKLLVIFDEAHHTHDDTDKWNEVVHRLHGARPIASQLDFSATPRFTKGTLFPWVISDYPLKQAIVDGVVKRPYKGITSITEAPTEDAALRYQGFLTAAVQRWREYRDQLAPVGKRPLLFVMLNSTAEADSVGDYLRTAYPAELGGDHTLIIHTKATGNDAGEVAEKDLERARRLARDVDDPANPVNAIVSVLMLREGWDVQNVTVVLGLRPYSAKANILPEQTIGRGLRLMFRGQNAGYIERVDIMGNKHFLDFVDDLERLEEVELGKFEVGKDKLVILTIQPVPEKAAYDISLPQLSPVLQRKRELGEVIDALDIATLVCPLLPRKEDETTAKTFRYEGLDFITLTKEFERTYEIPQAQTAGEVIGYYARLIAKELKLPTQFHHLVPKVRAFFQTKAFGETVDLEDAQIVRAMQYHAVRYVTVQVFKKALAQQIIEQAEPTLVGEPRRLSETQPFAFTNPSVLEPRKCILNFAPCTNEFERDFGKFLESCHDIAAWCKIPDRFGFAIEYTDQSANLRYYYPDFVARTQDDAHWLIETKGAETTEVAHKDAAAKLWCDNATLLTGVLWRYLKVPQKAFRQMEPTEFSELELLSVE